MKSKDQKMLEEAYISALQKQVTMPSDELSSNVPTPNQEPGSEIAIAIPAAQPPLGDHQPGNMEDEKEEDSMAKANLYSLYTDAKTIHDMLQNGYHLEAWMQQKIAVACDNISAVAKSAEYDVASSEAGCGCETASFEGGV